MKRFRSHTELAFASTVVLALLGAAFLATVGIDALEGRNEFQFFADSPTYHEAARGGLDYIETWADTVSVGANYLGPLVLLRIAGDNYFVVMALNALLLYFSVTSIARSLRLDSLRLLGLLLINPLTISSVLSVNKEIISLVFIAFMLHAFTRRSLPAFIAAAVISLLVRWQLTAFFVAVLLLCGPLNPLRRRHGLTLFALLAALSVLYTLLAPAFEASRMNFEVGAQEYEGSGFYDALVEWQERGFYWAVFPVKAAHLLFGLGLRLDQLVQPVNVYNHFWQLLHSTALLLMALMLWRAGRLRLDNDLVYLSLIYLAVFGTTPIHAPRYFFPVYVLWAVAMAATTAPPNVLSGAQQPPRRRRRGRTPSSNGSVGLPARGL